MIHTAQESVALRSRPPAARAPVRSELHLPKQMSPEAREALATELYAVQDQIFAGVSREDFVRYVIDSKAAQTWIQVHRDSDGRAVGYFAVHRYERSVRGRAVGVFRAEVGVLRAFRGTRASGTLLIREVMRWMLRHPTQPCFFLCSPVHPGSYAALVQHADAVWPSPHAETPADMADLSLSLAEQFGMPLVDPARPLVREVGWVTRDQRDDTRYWRRNGDAAVQHFLSQNPGYNQGYGLLTLVPCTFLGGLRALARFLMSRARRQLKARLG